MDDVMERLAKLEVRMNHVEERLNDVEKVQTSLVKSVVEIKTMLKLWKWILPILVSIVVSLIMKYLP